MGFVQIIEYTTSRKDEVDRVIDQWRGDTAGRRTATRALACADRDKANTYIDVIEFPSYEAAMANSSLPETAAMAEQFAKLCDDGPSFRNLDSLRTEDL
jgi:hypothetical protein